ncbi:MAG TPA: ankyrin repeat domain-containing protein [Edaphobacter sp.]|jgi:ankyrin repeat protein|nr:ankyrin repeat domain-containing protein [Edaphobacter sp.]
MPEKQLPARPNLQQYRKQAKDLLHAHQAGQVDAIHHIWRVHPKFHQLPLHEVGSSRFTLADAQLIIARDHSFESWPKFAAYLETQHLIRTTADLPDPAAAFIEAACVPRHDWHASGTLEQAQLILERYPQVATASIHTAAILADEPTVKKLLTQNPSDAANTGGPHNWDALTHLCFSRYLRLDSTRSEAFVDTARTLLDAGASANTGWYEMIDHPNPRPTFESVIYGAAGLAQHAGLTQLLLDRGADPNDEETPYHVPETYDNTVLKIILTSGKFNESCLNTVLLRKADWHDEKGIQLALENGANPNFMTHWGFTSLHQSLRRDNGLVIIKLLLDHGADPFLRSTRENKSAIDIAIHRGRGDVLDELEHRNIFLDLLPGPDPLIAACAQDKTEIIRGLTAFEPNLVSKLIAFGGILLAQFAGNNNTEGVRNLLDLGIPPDVLYPGDGYFDIASNSTALHVAAWRGWPDVVKLLIARGVPINAVDGNGRTALQLAIKAAVDSYWKYRRTPDSIRALLEAGATIKNVTVPTGYEEADAALRQYSTATG